MDVFGDILPRQNEGESTKAYHERIQDVQRKVREKEAEERALMGLPPLTTGPTETVPAAKSAWRPQPASRAQQIPIDRRRAQALMKDRVNKLTPSQLKELTLELAILTSGPAINCI